MEAGTKKEIRKEILAIREHMEEAVWKEKSRRIIEALKSHPQFDTARYILCYASYKKEVETTGLLEYSLAAGKRVFCPRVTGRDMAFYRIFSTDDLEPGFHGIPEPKRRPETLFLPAGKESRTLIVMPGAAFDRQRHRIGYGGGYYDRYMEKISGVFSVALAFSFQVRESVPYDTYDICPRAIITEEGEV